MIVGIWQDIILFDFNSSEGNFKVPYAYYNERMNNTDNSECFTESKEKVEEHLQHGFRERLSDFDPTHMFISTWHGIENTTGTVSYVKGMWQYNYYVKAKFGTTQQYSLQECYFRFLASKLPHSLQYSSRTLCYI